MVHDYTAEICSGCEAKLSKADSYLRGWFQQVKEKWPTAHCSWAFRNEHDQNEFFNSGKSTKPWPTSPHNFTIMGKPHSLAVDLFQIDIHGRGSTTHEWCAAVWTWSQEQGHKILWGGNFVHLRDYDHFQISGPSEGS